MLKFYDDLIQDKIFVINFFYATCRDICPLTTARLGELQDRLGDRVGRDIFIYTISIDPETDTPARLKEYANAMHAGPGWLFLTGLPEDIKVIRDRLGERARSLGDHSNNILLGNGRTGDWQRDSALGDIGRLAETVRALDPDWRTTPEAVHQMPGNLVAMPTGPVAMHGMFAKLCAGCHTVGHGDRVGPDLMGVTERRSRDWLLRFISDPEKMRRDKDPIAVALGAKFPTVRMPAMGVTENDAADMLAFIESQEDAAPANARLDALLALTTHEGRRLTRDDLKDGPVAVVFGFTSCPDVCPTTLLDWSNVLAGLGPDGDRLKVLFVSVDGERDTPAMLKTFMASFDRRIVALTGSADEIAAAAKAFDAYYEKVPVAGGDYTYDHSTKITLMSSTGWLRGTVDMRTPDKDRTRVLTSLLR